MAGVSMLGMVGAPVLALMALMWLGMYRLQVAPGPERRRATWVVWVTIVPSFGVTAWLILSIVVSLFD